MSCYVMLHNKLINAAVITSARILTTVLHKLEDHISRVREQFTGVHLPASVPGLGEVDLQLVQHGMNVHVRQVGD